MGIRNYKPTTPGRRFSSVSDFVEITRDTPEKSLVRPLHKTGGRNNSGRVTSRHRGGGHKRQYRVIDFRRSDKDGVPAKVAHIEYDPNRTARIALLHYADGTKRYIPATRCSCATSPWVPLCTPSSSTRVAAPRSLVPLAPPCSSSLRKAASPSCVCRPARSATWRPPAAPPSARSATPSSRTSTGARPVVCAGRASARTSVVSS